MSAIDTFRSAVVASRGNKPLSPQYWNALTNPPPGVAVDDVASFLDGFVGRDIHSYARWMRDSHADRVALFDTIRARLHGRRPATPEEAKRLAEDLRLVRAIPEDILRAFGLSANASPSVAADALEARLPSRETGGARRGTCSRNILPRYGADAMMAAQPHDNGADLRRHLLSLDDTAFALTWRDALEAGDMTDVERAIFRAISDERSRTHDARYELQARRDLALRMGRPFTEH